MRRLGGRLPLPGGWTDAKSEALIGTEATLEVGPWGELKGKVVVANEVPASDFFAKPGLWIEVESEDE